MNEESNTVNKLQAALSSKGFQGDQYKMNLDAWLCFTADGNKYLAEIMARKLGVDKLVNERIEKCKVILKDAVESGFISAPKFFTRDFGIRDGVIDAGIMSNVSGTNKMDETETTATYDDMLENKLNEISLKENEKYQQYSEYDIDMNSDYMQTLLDDPRLSREWERSDVPWLEFLLDKGLLRKKR